ncbi:hypothetical protein AALB39_18045 [Lachnospiraceae bacterium 54-53]
MNEEREVLLKVKTPEELEAEKLKRMVDEYAGLMETAAKTKERLEYLKGYFEKRAVNDLKDTKLKSATYWGSKNSRVLVTVSETVKPVSTTMIREVLGKVAPDFLKEETTTKLTDSCKRLLGMVFQGDYTEGDLEETIKAITADEKIQKILKKKLKGRFEKDKDILMRVAGLSDQEASDWAYLAAEVINWGFLAQVLEAGGWKGTTEEAIRIIRSSVIVDEGLKVGLEAEKEAPEAGDASLIK